MLFFPSLCQGLGTAVRTAPATSVTSSSSGFGDLSGAEDINIKVVVALGFAINFLLLVF